MPRVKDMRGMQYGSVEFLEFSGTAENSSTALWRVLCHKCGQHSFMKRTQIMDKVRKNKKDIDCGCGTANKLSLAGKTHGMCGHPLYRVWRNIKNRCLNPNYPTYKNYGARGITICQRWADSFERFKDDMSDGYEKGLQIDREDNSKGYESGNCRWVTARENTNNRRNTLYLSVNGKRLPLSVAAERLGVKRERLYYLLTNGYTAPFDSSKEVGGS